jgi:CheY-like chemotaxis protein
VVGDPTRITQVLINLVSNAIKFTEAGTIHVHLRVGQMHTDGSFMLQCTVTDTGIGIPPEKQALVFESFTQSDQSTSRKYGGFGLGLAISKKLAHLMQGELGVQSPLPNQERGAAFWFSVRLKQVLNPAQAVPAAKTQPEFKLRDDIRILVVDDNAMNVLLMQKIFRSMGITITSAQSGEEALALARTQAFDLVFMDIQMPEMDGLQASALLRQADFAGPIIAFSANAYKDDIHKSLQAGMNDHLSKPFTRQELVEVLAKWV